MLIYHRTETGSQEAGEGWEVSNLKTRAKKDCPGIDMKGRKTMKTLKRALSLMLAAVLILGLAACGADESEKEDTIKIGVPAYLNGDMKDYGDYVIASLELAVEEFNEAGGLDGKLVELIYEDQGSDQQSYINTIMKILNYDDLTAVIGNAVSAHTLAVQDMISEYKIPYMTCGSSVDIANSGNEYIWQPRMTDDLSGAMLAKTAYEEYNVKKPAVLYQNDSYGQGYCDAVLGYFEEQGVEPAIVIAVDSQETNFSPFFTQIVNSGCDGLVAIGNVGNASLILQAAYNVDFQYPKLMSGAMCSAEVFALAGNEASEGWISIAEWSNSAPRDAAKEYVEAYVEKAGREPNVLAVYAYDAICLVLEALKIAGTDDPAAVNEALGKIQGFEGAMSVMTARDNHNFSDSMYAVTIQNGEAVVSGVVERP